MAGKPPGRFSPILKPGGALPWPPRPSTRLLERAIPLLATPCFRRRHGRLGEALSKEARICPAPVTGLCRTAEIRFCPARLVRAKPPSGCASPKPCGRTLGAARRKSSTGGIRRRTRPKAKRFKVKPLKPAPAQNKISSHFFENGVFLGSYSDRRRPAVEWRHRDFRRQERGASIDDRLAAHARNADP